MINPLNTEFFFVPNEKFARNFTWLLEIMIITNATKAIWVHISLKNKTESKEQTKLNLIS